MIVVDSRLLKKTQEEVTRLNHEMKKLHAKLERLEDENDRLRPAHDYYMMIQKAAMSDENIGEIFAQLVLMAKLVSDDETPGLTKAA